MQLADFLAHDVDPSDPVGHDPEFIRAVVLPLFNALRTYDFRAEIDGVQHVPRDGPFMTPPSSSGTTRTPRETGGSSARPTRESRACRTCWTGSGAAASPRR